MFHNTNVRVGLKSQMEGHKNLSVIILCPFLYQNSSINNGKLGQKPLSGSGNINYTQSIQ